MFKFFHLKGGFLFLVALATGMCHEINKKLNEYLYWYNFKKVHKGSNYITPMYFINKNLIN